MNAIMEAQYQQQIMTRDLVFELSREDELEKNKSHCS